MPIYEYRCEECGEKFEKLVRSVSGRPDLECPRCGSTHVKKAISLFGGLSGKSNSSSGGSCNPGSL